MLNVKTTKHLDLDSHPEICAAVTDAELELARAGRVVVRASGTEPVIRVMVEGRDQRQVLKVAKSLAAVVTQVAG
jgi:phosphoglucosamine mutase